MRFLQMTVAPYRAHLALTVAAAAFAALFTSVALSAFHRPVPHGLRVGLVAPAPVAAQIRRALTERAPGRFELRGLRLPSQARSEIQGRRLDGAAVVTSGQLELLTAGAGGTAPVQAITSAFMPLARHLGRQLAPVDVVAPMHEDTQGLSAFFLALCVLFPSLAAGIAVGHALRSSPIVARVIVLLAGAAAAGVIVALIGDAISGLGHMWAIAGIVALFSVAISAPTAALGQIKPSLAALCVIAFLVLGIPVSGGPADLAAFSPAGLRALHGGLPLGVAADTIRNTVYFRASDTTGHLLVLAAYALSGLGALCLLASLARRPVAAGVWSPA